MAAETTTTATGPPRAPAPEWPSNPFFEAALKGLPKAGPGGPTSAELEAELWADVPGYTMPSNRIVVPLQALDLKPYCRPRPELKPAGRH